MWFRGKTKVIAMLLAGFMVVASLFVVARKQDVKEQEPMVLTFAEAVTEATRATFCGILAVNDGINGFLEGIVEGGSLGFQDATRALRRSVCNNSDDTVPIPSSEFTGGQCPVLYDGSLRVSVVVDGQDLSFNANFFNVLGPIEGAYLEPVPGQNSVRYGVITESGQVFVGATSATGVQGVSINNVIRQDGQPDDCGDPPPPPIQPYVPGPTTVSITYEDNSQTTINEDIDITIFAPFVAIGGAIIAPVTISGNTFSLVGELQLTPEFKLNLEPSLTIGGSGQQDDPSEPPDYPVGLPDPGPSKRVIVGAVVTATQVTLGRKTEIEQGVNPDIFAPRIGNISFLIATDKDVAWTVDIPIKAVRQFVPCPFFGGAVDVAATPELGFELDVRPVYDFPQT